MTGKKKVVITDYNFENVDQEHTILGPYCNLVEANTLNETELIKICSDAEVIITETAQITANLIKSLKNCRGIIRYGVGYNNVDVEAATEKGICVSTVPDYCLEEVSVHTIALLLSLVRKITVLNSYVKDNLWDVNLAKPIFRISQRQLGVLGFGRLGREVATRAKALGINVVAYDMFLTEDDLFEKHKVKRANSLEDLVRDSDYISIHVPLNDTTHHLFNEQMLKLMKPSAFLVNTSRGGIIDEAALIKALQDGWIAGVGLDVVEDEPIKTDNPLLELDNVIITPHVGYYSEESKDELQRRVAEEALRCLLGKWPINVVNPEVKE